MSSSKPRIGVIKPDHGFSGGFERLIDQLVRGLSRRGYEIEMVAFDAAARAPDVYGYPIPVQFRYWHDEYFQYVCHVEQTHRLALDDYDLVVATQPPTFLAKHRRVLGLFYHQARAFYDASDLFVEAGFVDADVHAAASKAVQEIDALQVSSVKHWLAGSEEVADRLKRFWNIGESKISPYRHPPICDVPADPPPRPTDSANVVCVSRLEFPKRTELVVAAGHLVAGSDSQAVQIQIVGGGSRMSSHVSLDCQLATNGVESIASSDELWLNRGEADPAWSAFDGKPSGRVKFAGAVTDADRDSYYANASVVVCPAWNEDYGLTALEAFAWRRPLIVCRDGGGLTEIVTDEVNGLIVDPTPVAIAAAIDRLLADDDLAERLAERGRKSLDAYTLENALDQFENGIEAALASTDSIAPRPSELAQASLAKPGALDHYMREGRDLVQGWLGIEAMQIVHELSAQQRLDGLIGPVAEIGVHHGQLFILLALETGPGELAIGFDLFENQDENVDGSGEGDRKILERNLAACAVDMDRIRLVTANSLDLDGPDVENYCGSPVRIFSVDGGHTAELTKNDLELASHVLAIGGIVVLDDYFNEMWPGVAEGTQQFMAENPGKLIPFGIGSNKVCFTNSAAHVKRYRNCITAAGGGHMMFENLFAGYPVTILTEL